MFNNQKDIQDLYKALTTNNFGQIGGPGNQTGGAALIPESLENTLKVLTFKDEHLKLWKNIAKKKAFSTVEEYNVVDSYGQGFTSFQPEGVAGMDTTSDFSREFAKVKCMNTTRSVTQLMNMVRTTEDPESIETQNGIKYILGQTERALFYGDSSLGANGQEGLEWDGIINQIANENTIDLRGDYLTDKTLNTASERVVNNYGVPNSVYMPIPVTSKFSEQYYPDQRALLNAEPGTLTAGTTISKFNSAIGGTMDIHSNIFMRRGIEKLDLKEVAFGQGAPTPPRLSVAPDQESTGAKFTEGVYKYAVVAVNHKGNTAPVVADQAVTITSANKDYGVKVSITNSEAQVHAADFFIVYRTEANKNDYYEIGRIGAKTQSPRDVTEFIDKNEVLPNTATAIVGDFSEESVVFKQLAPMFKLDYAQIAPVKRFGIFLYGMPVVYAPKRFSVIKNIRI